MVLKEVNRRVIADRIHQVLKMLSRKTLKRAWKRARRLETLMEFKMRLKTPKNMKT